MWNEHFGTRFRVFFNCCIERDKLRIWYVKLKTWFSRSKNYNKKYSKAVSIKLYKSVKNG